MRIDLRPPFSALFTLCLSMMAAVGLPQALTRPFNGGQCDQALGQAKARLAGAQNSSGRRGYYPLRCDMETFHINMSV